MARFFIDNTPLGSSYRLEGENSKHLSRSLRMKVGDTLTLCDGNGMDYSCTIKSIDADGVNVEIISKELSKSEAMLDITLYQALPKSDKFEFIIQKATELGVKRIVPVLSSFCVSRPKADSMERKLVRFGKVAEEAAKQSGRGVIPVIADVMNYHKAIDEISENNFGILCYEKATRPMSELAIKEQGSIAIIIGSEGGFSEEEAEYALKKNIHTVSLGSRILRCETAPIVAVTIALNMAGEF